ncbi:MAG: hypothetical protein QOF92_4247 [Pseudonocardiales bacterium]|nr:hypothetical protein [Pseudonocardiales bacterium]
MKSLPHRWRIAIGGAFAVLAAGVVVVAVRSGSDGVGAKPHNAADVRATIRTSDGVTLAAEVITSKGTGPAPLVVMPASWGATAAEYHVVGMRFAAAGYVVLAYTQRGFFDSGGEIDFAGPRTQRDVSEVITWALAHAPADPKRIGLLGVSYGAGMSLLAAANDSRIRAVVALSTWADMAASLHPNGTTSAYALGGLLSNAKTSGHPSALVASLTQRLIADPTAAGATIDTMSPSRSPMADIDALNRNQPAIMLANGYEDSLFGPHQLVDFFAKLTTPKRLQLAPGDHGGPESAGLRGKKDDAVDNGLQWLDHYLRGRPNVVAAAKPIQLQDQTTGVWHGYATWPGARQLTVDLAQPDTRTVTMQGTPSVWTAGLTTGTDSAATSGQPLVFSGLYQVPHAQLATMPTGQAFVWSGPAVTSPTLVSGTSSLHVSMASSGPSVTVFAYLYDVGASGTGQLMSVTPFTATGLTPDTAHAVTISLQPTSWTLPAGDHLELIVDTVDLRYHSAAPAGSTLTVTSTASHPATLQVPVLG